MLLCDFLGPTSLVYGVLPLESNLRLSQRMNLNI